MNKRLLLLLTIFLMALQAGISQVIIPAGNVSGCWTKLNSPYYIDGEITIPPDSTLVIERGVKVKFKGHYGFIVRGQLLAVGTPKDSIIFTCDSNNTLLSWKGIKFMNNYSLDTSRIIYCKIEHGKNYFGPALGDSSGGAIYVNSFSKLIISNSTICNCSADRWGGGIYCSYCSPVITNNTIRNNSSTYWNGGGLALYFSNAKLFNNTITSNYAQGQGGGICCYSSCPVIKENIFNNNTSTWGPPAILLAEGSHAYINKNRITNNHSSMGSCGIDCVNSNPLISGNILTRNSGVGGGVIDLGGSTAVIINNIICNNSGIVAISCTDASPTFINNTICNNDNSPGGISIEIYDNSSPVFINTIIWNNTALFTDNRIDFYDSSCVPDFYNCDIAGGINSLISAAGATYTGIFENNINADPEFVSPTAGTGSAYDGLMADWSLLETSPCINAGTIDTSGLHLPAIDYAGNPRIFQNRIDIGALESQQNISIDEKMFNNPFIIYPNPSNGKIFLILDNPCKENLKLEITRTNGELVYSKNMKKKTSKIVEQIDLYDYSNGLYFIKP